jgi:DNA invertase Pin-like site-specific DNA recombinase
VVSLKVAAYARVSTSDKDQDPETQLVALRDFARLQQWEIVGEYVDRAPANDPLHRTAWRRLLDAAAKRRFHAVLVFKLDRAFRSVKHMHDTLAVWEAQGIGFVSAREGFDTRTALGRLLLNVLASLAEFELEVLSERVKAGMDRARRQGVHIGRPPVTARPGFVERWAAVRAELEAGRISRSEAARRLDCGYATLLRLLAGERRPASA